jgi:hypothetical protein
MLLLRWTNNDDGRGSLFLLSSSYRRLLQLCHAALTATGTLVNDGTTLLYLGRKHDCDNCELKALCCPKDPFREIPRNGANPCLEKNAKRLPGSLRRAARLMDARSPARQSGATYLALICSSPLGPG